MQGNEVGSIRVNKVTSINDSNTDDFHFVALVDTKNASMILTHWYTKIKTEIQRKEEWDQNRWNSSAVKHKRINTVVNMK